MKKIGFVGLGDMGIGLTKNLLEKGFELTGFDIREDRVNELIRQGGKPAENCREVGQNSDAVFVMVLNGQQVREVVLGKDGLIEGMKREQPLLLRQPSILLKLRYWKNPCLKRGLIWLIHR